MNRSLAVALISAAVTGVSALAIAGVAGAGLRIFHSVSQWLARHDRGPATEPERTPRPRMAWEAAQHRLLAAGARLSAAGRRAARDVTGPQRTGEVSEPGQAADRFARAAGQLGSGKLDVRLGGIYALERVAHDSPEHHPAVMDALAVFVRKHSHARWSPLDRHRQPARHLGRTTLPDVQAAITAIGRRSAGHDRQLVNLGYADLPGADLTRANLTYGNLAYADLTGADLTGADLTGADLTGADLTGADLTGADLTGAIFKGADLTRAKLTRANLTREDLTGAGLFRANLPGADLTGANLTRADLTRAGLTGADLTGAGLFDADLASANLTGADLTGADLLGACWPPDAVIPAGWQRDAGSGRLRRPGHPLL